MNSGKYIHSILCAAVGFAASISLVTQAVVAREKSNSGDTAKMVSTVGHVRQNTPIWVYILAGQSNMTGQGYMKNLPPHFVINRKVLLYHSPGDLRDNAPADTWIHLRQAAESPDRFGPELSFGNRIQQFFPHHHIALIKDAWTSTDLEHHWNPGKNRTDKADWGPQFKELVQTVDSGMKSLRKLGYSPHIVGMLWQQGENDAFDGTKVSAQYGWNLYHFIHRVRQQFRVPHMLFVYGLVIPQPDMGLFTVNAQCRALVRLGEREVAHNSKSPLAVHGAYLVNTNDLELRAQDPKVPIPYLKRDHLHFGTMGQIDLGYLYADSMYRHQTLLPPHFRK
jgi:hypothetical protein